MDTNIDKTFDDLIDLMLIQAQKFLEELGEFFPYASVLSSEGELSTLGIYNDDDSDFTAKKAIDVFQNNIQKEIENGSVLIGAIGIDVLIKETNENAIMVKATEDGIKWHERNFLYTIKDNVVEIEKYIP
ncbi:hypothetical protein DOS84_18675 [Flavobacterium aquariorum]|jgi:hypothetical protein|uniref:Uncharacterized protein n=1 Tax=Flavobacterium aquariorum TaxID=2217670 RepID=A0A2W7U979_9FLAO|nr:hypothetical protein [Flavobacterium aquariorum]PZX91847.1 hypothetical protein DOS84_18675 [Flavobacterium aquariorum]